MTLHKDLTGVNMHDAFAYAQADDPGAVGSGVNWLDTTNADAPVWKRRNAANDGWIIAALPTTGGTVTGALTVEGATTLDTTLAVTGATTLTGALTGAAATLASATISGAATVGTTLNVAGPLTLAASGQALLAERGEHILSTDTPALIMSISAGTSAAPVTTAGPLIKISKYEDLDATAMPNPVQNQRNAAIHVATYSALTSTAQNCSVHAFAHGGAFQPGGDVVAVVGTSWINNPTSEGFAAGGYFEGRRNYDTGMCAGIEVRAWNQTAEDATYSSGGASDCTAIWISASGTADMSAAIAVRADPSARYHVGIGFTNLSVLDATFRDDSPATISLDVNGTHDVGLDMTGATLANAALYLPNNKGIVYRNAANSADVTALTLDTSDRASIRGGVLLVSASGATVTGDSATMQRLASDASGFALSFYRARASNTALSNGDVISDFTFQGRNSTPATKTFAQLRVITANVAAGTESAQFRFSVVEAGSLVERLRLGGTGLAFFAGTETAKQTVTGSRGGNAALASLLTALAAYGLITDSTSA